MEFQTKQMTQSQFLQEIDAILEAPPGTTTVGDTLASLQGWDSMAIISFISMTDEKLGCSLNIDQLISCKTVADLAGLCDGKIV
jgi:acyl carrier protein